MKKAIDFFGSVRVGLALLIIIGGIAAVAALFSLDGFYHTWFFKLLLALLFLNMLLCTLKRCKVIFSTRKDLRQGNWRSFGLFFLHAGFLFVLLGGAVYSFWGREAFVSIAEGETASMAQVFGQEKSFNLHLNDFRIDLYPDGSPSQFISRVTIWDRSKRIGTFDISVNHPLKYRGVTVYQERYGWAVRVAFGNSDGEVQALVKEGEFVNIPGTGYRVLLYRYIPNYDPSYGMESKNLEPANPRVIFSVYEGHERIGVGIARLGEEVSVTEEVNFRFAETVPLSTLKVKSDPGIIFVWAGFVLLLAGIFMALYQPRLWGAGAKNNGEEGEV
ncbi:MAG: cytochrome c biogenesis protein ResB [Syntrophothermus sp.]|uniref:cytochrome c biogenesis protein ResB n=1 Tax=Syntrophothermus sp. TaxID=2736299 RepID=UPI00257C0D79|nr:cytochrome c biogenesis protein ResB [Syntrophothermus sp.]NSW84260.1 cytochrome c biogenesis protein ResB [Syntrophothermus sp.]